MFIQETEKRILDALNQRKYLKLNDIEVRAVDSRTTVLTVDGEKFAEVVYKNDFLDDATSSETNFLIDELLTYVVDNVKATKCKKFLDSVIFSNLLGCGVIYDDNVPVIKVAQIPVAFWSISTIMVLYKHRGFMNTTSIAEIKGLQNKLRFIKLDMQDRSVCDDTQYNELVRKFTDVIEFTDYNVDIADLISALHDAMTNFEMYD